MFDQQNTRKVPQFFNKIIDRILLHRYVYPFNRKNKDRRITDQNTICIFAHPRGGSTWFAQILATLPNSVYFDEPLLRRPNISPAMMPDPFFRKLDMVSKLKFYYEQPIPHSVDWPEAQSLFSELLSGRAMSIGLYRESGLSRLAKADTYIIKFNQGHLLMHWLLKHFSMAAIVLVRHPCAVIASQLHHGSTQRFIFESRLPDFRYSGVYREYENIYNSIESNVEYFAFRWALKIQQSINCAFQKDKYLIVSYESLVANFEKEIARVFEYIDKPVPEEVWSLYDKPSESTLPMSYPTIGSTGQLETWKERLSRKDVDSIFRIIDMFGISYYSEEVMPDLSKLYGITYESR